MGGRAAEQLVFGVQTTGAANDIERATDLARKMVMQYGMSDQFGLMALTTVANEYLDGQSMINCADTTAAQADTEVKNLLQHAYEKASAVLKNNRELLDDIALFLLQKETITGDELMAFVNADKNRLPAAESTADGDSQSAASDAAT